RASAPPPPVSRGEPAREATLGRTRESEQEGEWRLFCPLPIAERERSVAVVDLLFVHGKVLIIRPQRLVAAELYAVAIGWLAAGRLATVLSGGVPLAASLLFDVPVVVNVPVDPR